MNVPKPQEIYRHFKGRYYQIITLATNTETKEEMVVYQALYGDFSVYCRPLYMFTEVLDTTKYPDTDQVRRFELVKPAGEKAREKISSPGIPAVLKRDTRTVEPGQTVYPDRDAYVGVMGKTIEEEARDLNMDKRVVAFLDADSSEKRLQILSSLMNDITDDQIDICAMAIDAKIPDGDIFDRYLALRDVLNTKSRFETNRLRE